MIPHSVACCLVLVSASAAFAQNSMPPAQVEAALAANNAYTNVPFEDRGPVMFQDAYPTVGNKNTIRHEMRAQSATACDGDVALLSVRRNEFHAARTKQVFAGDRDYFNAPLWGDNSDSHYVGYYKRSWLQRNFANAPVAGSEGLVEKCTRAKWLLFDEFFEGVDTPVRTIVMQGRTNDVRYTDLGPGGGDVPATLSAAMKSEATPPSPVQPLTDEDVEDLMLVFTHPLLEQEAYDFSALTPLENWCKGLGEWSPESLESLTYVFDQLTAHKAFLDSHSGVASVVETLNLRIETEIALGLRETSPTPSVLYLDEPVRILLEEAALEGSVPEQVERALANEPRAIEKGRRLKCPKRA